MKKILYIFLLSGLLSSCDDLLDVEPETLLSFDNYFKTELDLESTLYSYRDLLMTSCWLMPRRKRLGNLEIMKLTNP